jgi:chaperone required for assembly of F1-ATPase
LSETFIVLNWFGAAAASLQELKPNNWGRPIITMVNLFDDIFGEPVTDPNEAARETMRARRRRFYATATAREREGAFAVELDDKPVRTPARRLLAFPTLPLAERAATEWRSQGEFIDPAKLPLTRLANTIIDAIGGAHADVAADVARYIASDLLFYRAEGPERLVARQNSEWDPILTWAREVHGARFVLAQGVVFVTQPEAAVAAMRRLIPKSPWRLGAVHVITTLTGSALIALALAEQLITPDDAWAAAHVDENWNQELWGRDDVAIARRALHRTEFDAAISVLRLAPETP